MGLLANTFKNGHKRSYQSGQILLYQGEKTMNTYFVKSGYIKVYDINARGDEKTLLLLGKGDIFPLVWTFGASNSLMHFYEVLEDAEISVISKSSFLKAIQNDHALSIALLKYFVSRTKELMTRVESIEGINALHKVGQVLTYLSQNHGSKVAKYSRRIQPSITHQLIAQMAGLTRETVSIQMKLFQDAEAIIFDDSGVIVHADRIADMLSEE